MDIQLGGRRSKPGRRRRRKPIGVATWDDSTFKFAFGYEWAKLLRAPYTDMSKWRPMIFIRAMLVELLYSTVYYTVTLMLVGGALATGVNAFLAALLVGLGSAILFYALTSGRQATRSPLPRLLNPALLLAEIVHRRIGLGPALGYLVAQGAGAFAAWGLVEWLSTGAQNFLVPLNGTVGGFSTISVGAYVFFTGLGSLLIVYTYLQEGTIDDNKKEFQETRIHNRMITAAVIFGVRSVHYLVGIWRFNPMLFVAAAIGTGEYDATVAPIELLMPLAGGLLAYFIHFVTWNLNDITRADTREHNRGVRDGPGTERAETQEGDFVDSKIRTARVVQGRRRVAPRR